MGYENVLNVALFLFFSSPLLCFAFSLAYFPLTHLLFFPLFLLQFNRIVTPYCSFLFCLISLALLVYFCPICSLPPLLVILPPHLSYIRTPILLFFGVTNEQMCFCLFLQMIPFPHLVFNRLHAFSVIYLCTIHSPSITTTHPPTHHFPRTQIIIHRFNSSFPIPLSTLLISFFLLNPISSPPFLNGYPISISPKKFKNCPPCFILFSTSSCFPSATLSLQFYGITIPCRTWVKRMIFCFCNYDLRLLLASYYIGFARIHI